MFQGSQSGVFFEIRFPGIKCDVSAGATNKNGRQKSRLAPISGLSVKLTK